MDFNLVSFETFVHRYNSFSLLCLVEPILSNASAATFLEVNSFQIDTGTGIAFEISKNHIFT